MIDPSILFAGDKNPSLLDSVQGGLGFGQKVRALLASRAAGNMAQLGTSQQQQDFANNSMFSRELNQDIKARQAEAVKIKNAEEDRQFEVQKRNIAQQKMTDSALAAAIGGNPSATNFMLGQLRSTGRIDEPTYNSYQQYLTANANNPGAISELVRGLTANAAEKPEQYLMPDANNANTNQTSIANNVLDNTTSRSNNSADNANRITTTGMNNQTQIKTTGMNNDTQVKTTGMNNQTSLATNAASNAVDLQRLHMEQNKGELVTGADGNAYIFYPSLGKYERYLGTNGQPVAGEAGKVASLATNPLKENQRIQKLNTTLGEIEKLLPGATNSYLGAGVDQAARLFGKATDGAVVSSQLNALAGQVTSMMPRMEGPQSNFDVQLYREMAGDLGNPTIPVEQRMAALKTIRDLNQKYGQNLQQGASQAAPTVNTSDKPNAMSFFK